jgi:Ner family transcriptional regulator
MIARNLKSDWHPADIIAEVRKTGVSLAQLSRENGMASGTLANALKRPWPKGEWIIADRIGLLPSMIWPTRYTGKNITRKPSPHRSVLNCLYSCRTMLRPEFPGSKTRRSSHNRWPKLTSFQEGGAERPC